MTLRAWRLYAALPLLATSGACAHSHAHYPPPPPPPYEEPAGYYEPQPFPRRIGVQVEPLTPDLREYFGVEGDAGLLVEAVEARSPAAEAGLRAGDVLLRADGARLYEPGDLIEAVQRVRENEPLVLSVLRKGREQRVEVVPRDPRGGREPEPYGAPPGPPPGGPGDVDLRERVRELELRVEELERELARERGRRD